MFDTFSYLLSNKGMVKKYLRNLKRNMLKRGSRKGILSRSIDCSGHCRNQEAQLSLCFIVNKVDLIVYLGIDNIQQYSLL